MINYGYMFRILIIVVEMVLSITVPCIGTSETGWDCFDITGSYCSEEA